LRFLFDGYGIHTLEVYTMNLGNFRRLLFCFALLGLATSLKAETSATSVSAKKHKRKKHPRRTAQTSGTSATTTQAGVLRSDTASAVKVATARRRTRGRHARIFFNPWTEPTYADSTVGDNVDGEDLAVRKAAVDALGPYNGSIVVADSSTGRILSIVNQKLALKGAYQPCSTVKMVVSLASLSEGLVTSETALHLSRRYAMDMTQAIAHSNNTYFAKLGQQLGFDRVEKYAKLYGLGEKAGLDIPGEEAGYLTEAPPDSGVGMMTSFGDGIRLTPLELTSIVNAIANGGTMYYLQYPRSDEEVQKFVPRIKRILDIQNYVPEIKPGMMGAVEYGTARRANFDPNAPVYGKTGTCTDTAQPGVHLGWFGSFGDVGKTKVTVVVLLTGGRGIGGSVAAGIAGQVYRGLEEQHYGGAPALQTSLISLQSLQ
jgi:beta-lactamase class D